MLGKKGVLVIIGLSLAILIASLLLVFKDKNSIVAIEAALKAEWDKPNHPIRIPALAIHGDYAIADWIQEPRGGRALLIYNGNVWQTILCGDVNMKQVSNLISAGVPQNDAKS